jgi:RNA polymerase sigma-70 factor (ECF subfamily)
MTGELATAAMRETAGDERDRLAGLFDAHHRRLFSLARRLSASSEDARDLVQETFLRAAAAPQRVPHGPGHEEAWLVRVLINLCRDRWRRARTARKYLEGHPHAQDGSPDPETALLAHSDVWRAMTQLPPRRRAVVVMHEIEGVAAPRIARMLGIAPVTVRWHLLQGRRQLAAALRRTQGT